MALEDFTTYTEVEPGGHITLVVANHIDFISARNKTTYLYKDMGVNHFGDFEHLVDFQMLYSTVYAAHGFIGMANILGDIIDVKDASEDGVFCHGYRDGSGYQIQLRACDTGVLTGDAYNALVDTWYYCTFKRLGTTVTLKIYSDTGRTDLLDTLTLTCVNTAFRYMYACFGIHNKTSEYQGISDIEDLDLQEAAPPTPTGILKPSKYW